MKPQILRKLKSLAKAAAARAYCPYSHVHVGAALVTKSGKLYSGCNVENLSYGATVCAERTAIWKAVTEGHHEIVGLYLYTQEQWSPCGQCLQVMSEFLAPATPIILGSAHGAEVVTLQDLLPRATDKQTYNRLRRQG